MTIQQFLTAGALSWLFVTLVRCALDEFRLHQLRKLINKKGFL